MKIALIGYGKMGHAIEEIALQRGHEIVLKVGIENIQDNTIEQIKKADVAIEFTGPEVAFDNVIRCFDAGVPVVSGSTDWLQRFEEATTYCNKKNGTMLYASNFSVGVNIFFAINKRLAELMAPHKEYDVKLKEIHHTQKKDAPSGTAISLANDMMQELTSKTKWVNHKSDNPAELIILSRREDEVVGIHTVEYVSAADKIEIRHEAFSRAGFARGAILAAEWIVGKKGMYAFPEILNQI